MIVYAYVFAALVTMLLAGNALYALARRGRLQIWYNVAILALLCADSCALGLDGTATTYLGFAQVNPFSEFFIVAVTLCALLVNVLAHGRQHGYRDFALLSSFALFGAYLVATAGSLVSVFLGLEIVSLPTLFIMLTSSKQNLEASAKFFVLSSVAVALLSFAVVLAYGGAGTLALSPMKQGGLMMFAAALFVASIGALASIFPFCAFVPDVYQGSPAYVTATLGGVNGTVALAALVQVAILIFVSSGAAYAAIAALAAVTMLFGSMAALVQKNFKRMLAYVSISQAGYVLMGIAAQSAAGVGGILFQIFAEAVLFIGVLAIIGWLESNGRSGTDDLIGLYKENRFAALSLTVFLLAMAGLPFTIGFVGKFAIVVSAVGSGLLWLAVIGIINGAVMAFFLVRILTAVYTDKLGVRKAGLDTSTAAVVAVCLAITVILGVWPQPLATMAWNGAGYLFGILGH